jgi:leucyl/phenylalanyl-tRNA--protein transferase
VRINGFFAGESMFHVSTDASKVALWRLVQEMSRAGMALLDVQWQTPHLASLGVIRMGRLEYMEKLSKALEAPNLGWSR